jgi:hypothetical protein
VHFIHPRIPLMLNLIFDSISSERTRYIIRVVSNNEAHVHLFGTGRDDTSRFYARSKYTERNDMSECAAPRCSVSFYSVNSVEQTGCENSLCLTARDGTVNLQELSDTEYASSMLSRELWLAGSLPDLADCGVCVMRVPADLFLFDLQCVLKVFRNRSNGCCNLVFENDKRDPRRLHIKCQSAKSVYSFRVTSATFVPFSRGCVLAIHDVPYTDKSTAHNDKEHMSRCKDSPYRFHTNITLDNVDDLCSYLQCANLEDNAELVITICSQHGTIRVIDRAVESMFEATIVCTSSAVTCISHKRKHGVH